MNIIERAEELLSKATSGPWKVFRDKSSGETLIGTAWDHPQLKGPDSVVGHIYSVRGEYVYIQNDDAQLIAESPTLLQGLIDLVKQQREIIQKIKYDADCVKSFSSGGIECGSEHTYTHKNLLSFSEKILSHIQNGGETIE